MESGILHFRNYEIDSSNVTKTKSKETEQEAKSKNQTEAAIVLHFASAHSWVKSID
jgi:hypothetical protein